MAVTVVPTFLAVHSRISEFLLIAAFEISYFQMLSILALSSHHTRFDPTCTYIRTSALFLFRAERRYSAFDLISAKGQSIFVYQTPALSYRLRGDPFLGLPRMIHFRGRSGETRKYYPQIMRLFHGHSDRALFLNYAVAIIGLRSMELLLDAAGRRGTLGGGRLCWWRVNCCPELLSSRCEKSLSGRQCCSELLSCCCGDCECLRCLRCECLASARWLRCVSLWHLRLRGELLPWVLELLWVLVLRCCRDLLDWHWLIRGILLLGI
jgi:hypothetical protein